MFMKVMPRPFRTAFIYAAALLLITSCEKDIPLMQMSLARYKITRAAEVNADKYARDEFIMATEHLLKCHDDIKKGDKKKLLEDAGKALKFAGDAIEKSLPPLSMDTLKEAERLFDELKKKYDLKYSSGELVMPEEKIKKSREFHGRNMHWESYIVSKDAIRSIKTADRYLMETLKKIAEEKISSSDISHQNALQSDLAVFFSDDLVKASALIDRSKALYGTESYQEAISSAEEAFDILKSVHTGMETRAVELRKKMEAGERKNVPAGYYSVKTGDCLWKIAWRLRKNPKLWPLIYAANRDTIKDPDLIFPGQKFIIPSDPSSPEKVITNKKTILKDKIAAIDKKDKNADNAALKENKNKAADNLKKASKDDIKDKKESADLKDEKLRDERKEDLKEDFREED
jgi:LysM repeat protein